MTESLTLDELRDIAGCKTRLSLIRWLDRVGWVYTLNARSEPIVGRAYARAKLSGVSITAAVEPRFDFGAIAQ